MCIRDRDRIAGQRKSFILDCSAIPFIDSTAANVLEVAAAKSARAGVRFIIAGASPQVRRMLYSHNVRPPHVRFRSSVEKAVDQVRRESARAAIGEEMSG